jgi:hypothetical protein
LWLHGLLVHQIRRSDEREIGACASLVLAFTSKRFGFPTRHLPDRSHQFFLTNLSGFSLANIADS